MVSGRNMITEIIPVFDAGRGTAYMPRSHCAPELSMLVGGPPVGLVEQQHTRGPRR